MIPVLVGDDKQINMLGDGAYIVQHIDHLALCVGGPKDNATIDEHKERRTVLAGQGDEKTVTQTLTIHTNFSATAVMGGPDSLLRRQLWFRRSLFCPGIRHCSLPDALPQMVQRP